MFGPVVKEMSFKDISLKILALVSIYSVEQLIYTDSVEGIMRDISVTLFRVLTSRRLKIFYFSYGGHFFQGVNNWCYKLVDGFIGNITVK